jgi:hypothetical protein
VDFGQRLGSHMTKAKSEKFLDEIEVIFHSTQKELRIRFFFFFFLGFGLKLMFSTMKPHSVEELLGM